MTARAGSSLWLLKHEVRMFFFNAGLTGKKGAATRSISKVSIAVWIAAAALLHLFAFTVVGKLRVGALEVPPQVVMGVTGLFAAAFSMMMSSGLKTSVGVLFERGDLDLLLSSPLSSRVIFMVRLAGIVVGLAGIYLFFLAPFAHAGLVLGQYRWLGIYPGVLGMAALAASLSMLITLALVRLLGVRRTRVVAQVLGALSGALFFLLSQVYANTFGGLRRQAVNWIAPMLAPGAALGPDSALWLPGHALLGAPGPLLAMSLIALAVFGFTVRFTHRFFVHGLEQAVSQVRTAQAPPGGPRYRFGRSLTHTVIVKEWRLIARDPQLISQVLLQLLYIMPLCFILMVKGTTQMAGVGAALTFLSGSLTASLAWIIIAAEDAPDLLRAAPCGQGTIRRAKLAAVAMPAPAIVFLPLLWVLARDPIAGLLTCATVVCSVASSALIAMWCGRPAARGDFKARGKGNFLSNMLETLNGFAWAGVAFMLLSSRASARNAAIMALGAGALVAVALLLLSFGWMNRRRDD